MTSKNLLIILGATAVGKTNLAVQIANYFGGEIISADSRQIFTGMDIGTGKDLREYGVSGNQIPHHLINIRQAGERYDVNSFKNDFYNAFEDIGGRGKLPILCGGTGMYIHSVLQNQLFTAVPINAAFREVLQAMSKQALQERLNTYAKTFTAHADSSAVKRLIRAIEVAEYLNHNKLEELQRPTIRPLIIGLYDEVETRRLKILERLRYRLDNGLIEEVQQLIASGVSPEMLNFYGLEYKFVVAYLNNDFTLEMLKEKLGIAICQYGKRQMTFFRKMEKDGVDIQWMASADKNYSLKSDAISLVEQEFQLK